MVFLTPEVDCGLALLSGCRLSVVGEAGGCNEEVEEVVGIMCLSEFETEM